MDTLDAVVAAPIQARRVLVLDGHPEGWRLPGWSVVTQRGRGLDERLANGFADVGGPALLIGMDTPQIDADLIGTSATTLLQPGVDAVIGPTPDGGFWAIGLREPNRAVFAGVPMSTAHTCAAQRDRLRSLGLSVRVLPTIRDVDTFEDAVAVAPLAPESRFAEAFARMAATSPPVGARS